MKKLRINQGHEAKPREPYGDLKPKLGSYLKGREFQRAFAKMVRSTIETGREHRFDVIVLDPSLVSVKDTKLHTSTVQRGLPDQTHDWPISKDSDRVASASLSILDLHTHPYKTKPAGFGIPSPDDVMAISHSDFTTVGIVVPVDILTSELNMVVFQPRNRLSYIGYNNLWHRREDKDIEVNEQGFLRLAAELGILRFLKFVERTKPILAQHEIDLILKIMEVRHSPYPFNGLMPDFDNE